jgi:hypothetical protein
MGHDGGMETRVLNEQQNSNDLLAVVNNCDCPFKIGEVAVFKSWFRFEVYITKVLPIHIEYWGEGWLPEIKKATIEQKQMWYDNDNYELVIEELYSFPKQQKT